MQRYTFYIGADEKEVDTSTDTASAHYARCLEEALPKLEEADDPREVKNILQSFFNSLESHRVTEAMLAEHKNSIRTFLNTEPDKADIIKVISNMSVPGEGYLNTEEESADTRPSSKR